VAFVAGECGEDCARDEQRASKQISKVAFIVTLYSKYNDVNIVNIVTLFGKSRNWALTFVKFLNCVAAQEEL
jgi:hypothetical protein